MVAELSKAQEPVVIVYREDDHLWSARPEVRPYPARWWRHVAMRAADDVPGTAINYLDEIRR
jgi:hypothetical protein